MKVENLLKYNACHTRHKNFQDKTWSMFYKIVKYNVPAFLSDYFKHCIKEILDLNIKSWTKQMRQHITY